jgi:hypothetical protein
MKTAPPDLPTVHECFHFSTCEGNFGCIIGDQLKVPGDSQTWVREWTAQEAHQALWSGFVLLWLKEWQTNIDVIFFETCLILGSLILSSCTPFWKVVMVTVLFHRDARYVKWKVWIKNKVES